MDDWDIDDTLLGGDVSLDRIHAGIIAETSGAVSEDRPKSVISSDASSIEEYFRVDLRSCLASRGSLTSDLFTRVILN